jgi:DNA-directed RNA polymerase subunit RPC12/RpoP
MTTMESEKVRLTLHCTQCGADLDIPEGEHFIKCSHCASTLYLDRNRIVFHYAVTRTLDAEAAERILRRWMAGDEMARGLDHDAQVEEPVLRYFPLWRFKVGQEADEQFRVKPAAARTLGLLDGLTIPPGELRSYDPGLARYLVRPTVPLEAAWAGQGVHEVALVSVPLFFFRYHCRGQTYRAAVEGSGGRVLAEAFPRRWDWPYRGAAGSAFAILVLVASLAYLLVSPGEEGWAAAYALRGLAQLLAAVPLFFLARRVARGT